MNPITKAQALSQIREAIDIYRKQLKFAVAEEAAWESGAINGLQDALQIVQAIDSLDEVPDDPAWEFVPSHDNGRGEAVPDFWRHEDTGEIVWENPEQEQGVEA